MPLLEEIGDYLSTGGVGTVGTDLFLGYLPEAPDAVVAVYETGGLPPVRAMRSAPGQPVVVRPRVQVLARAAEHDYAAARSKVGRAYDLLEGLGDRTLGGVRYLWVGAVQEPFLMGRDSQGRVMLACNFDVVKDSTSTST